jgi:hypothetical protein
MCCLEPLTEAPAPVLRTHMPGCATIWAGFGVRHLLDSPRYNFYCRDHGFGGGTTSAKGFNGNISSNRVTLTAPSGAVHLEAQPGTFPPADAAAVPDLEGATLCAVVVVVDDAEGKGSSQEFDVACPDEYQR